MTVPRLKPAEYSILVNDTRATRILLATRVLGVLCDQREDVSPDDRTALKALVQEDAESRLPLRLLAALVLDRERHKQQ